MAEFKNDNWINIDDAAEYLGVRRGTIRDWIRKGKGGQHIKSENSGSLSAQS